MLRITKLLIRKRAALYLLCSMELLLIPVFGKQQPKDSSAIAPVPTPIATAQKIFVSNAPGDSLPSSLGGTARPYQEFYTALKSWGHYQLVSSPTDADLVLEISFANPIVGVNVMSTSGGGSTSALLLKLVIVEPKSNIPLWWFTEPFELRSGFSHRKESLDKMNTAKDCLMMD